MKKLHIVFLVAIGLALIFCFNAGTVLAQKKMTETGATVSIKITQILVNKKSVQSIVTKSVPATGTFTLYTDLTTGDPTTGSVPPPSRHHSDHQHLRLRFCGNSFSIGHDRHVSCIHLYQQQCRKRVDKFDKTG